MRQDSVGANAQVSEDGTRVTGHRPLAPKTGKTCPRGNGRAQPFQSVGYPARSTTCRLRTAAQDLPTTCKSDQFWVGLWVAGQDLRMRSYRRQKRRVKRAWGIYATRAKCYTPFPECPLDHLGLRGAARGCGGGGFECNGLFYIRGCQEHCSPSAGGASLVRDIQPLSPLEDARGVPCPWVFHLSRCIFVSSDDANQFRN